MVPSMTAALGAVLLLWVLLFGLLIVEPERPTRSEPRVWTPKPWGRWATVGLVLALCGLLLSRIAWAGLINVDDWLFMGIGRWVATHPGDLGVLLTEYTLPTEPVVRVLPLLWYGLDHWWIGDQVLLWRLTTLAAHGGVAFLVYQLGKDLLGRTGPALAAALMFAFHPAHAEVFAWLSSARESILAAALILGAIRCHIRNRPLSTALLAALALLCREHALALVVLLPLVDWLKERRVHWRRAIPFAAVVLLFVLWRFSLHEPSNSVQSSYFDDFFGASLVNNLSRVLLELPALVAVPVIPGVWPYAVFWAGLICVGLGALLWRGGRPDSRTQLLPWTLFASVWLLASIGPTLAQLQFPEGLEPGVRLPEWHLRNLYLAVIGPCWAFGWLLGRTPRAWEWWGTRLAVVVCALGLYWNLAPYAELGARVSAAEEALDSQSFAEGVAVRFREPQDPVVSLLLYRSQLNPEAAGLPVLVGEPRCGCVQEAIKRDPASVETPREVARQILRPLSQEPAETGSACGCERWRPDARYYSFDGSRFLPDAPLGP